MIDGSMMMITDRVYIREAHKSGRVASHRHNFDSVFDSSEFNAIIGGSGKIEAEGIVGRIQHTYDSVAR